MDPYSRLADIILSLEGALREQKLWQEVPPEPELLASPHPFCVDTLTFPQWLQYVFIVRVRTIIEQQATLPASSEIVPMAEEWFREDTAGGKNIIRILDEFDSLIGRP